MVAWQPGFTPEHLATPHTGPLDEIAWRPRHGICGAKMLDKTSSIICAFWLSICRTSLAVSALRIVRCCLNIRGGTTPRRGCCKVLCPAGDLFFGYYFSFSSLASGSCIIALHRGGSWLTNCTLPPWAFMDLLHHMQAQNMRAFSLPVRRSARPARFAGSRCRHPV